jgi:hypothetical protein
MKRLHLSISTFLPICGVVLGMVFSAGGRSEETASADAEARFLKLSELAVAELNKEVVPFEERHRKSEEPKTHHVPFFEDSYAIRALCVAYDMTGDTSYLDACMHWADRVVALQKKMVPRGAYFPNYGGMSRQPGQDHGDWWAADSGSIAMGVLAVAARTADVEQKNRYVQSVRDFADLVVANYVGKNGGITDGIWSEYKGEWWSSTAIVGGLLYLLHEETREPAYLRTARGAMDWTLRHDFRKSEPLGFKDGPAGVVFYTFEFYAAGLKRVERGSDRRKTAEEQIADALKWMAENQKGRGARTSLDYFGNDTYMAGMPYLMYAFARQLPDRRDLARAADQELDYITKLLFKDGDPAATRLAVWEPMSWTMMSYAEKLRPGAILRTSNSRSAPVQAAFHVAADGSDDNPGTQTKPFATVEKARQAVRAVNKEMTGDVVIVLHGGTYKIAKTLAFDAADSGTGGHEVIYRAVPKEIVVVSGGRRISSWQPDVGKRWKAKTDLENFRQLYVGGTRAIRARSGMIGNSANAGRWEYLRSLPRSGALAGGELVGNEGYRTSAVEMAGWRNPGDIELCCIESPTAANFNQTRCKVAGIRRDGDHAMISMLQPYFTHARIKEGLQVGLPSYIENALELLDEPGEWYFDRATKTVCYIPRPGEDMNTVEVIAPVLEKLVELRGTLDQPVHNIRFEGISFRHGGWLRPSKIGHCDVQANFIVDSHRKDSFERRPGGFSNVHNENLKSAANVVCHAAKSVRFERCAFNQLGGAGLDIEFGSQDNVVAGCRFYDVSGTAVQVGDVLKDDHHPDDPRKIVKNNAVVNCYIHDCSLEYMGGPGVFVGHTEGTVVAHNEITRLPYTGISVGWGWGEEDAGGCVYKQPFFYSTPTPSKNSRIEMNHIHHVMNPFQDGGGIYTIGNMPGTILRGNHIHDNVGEPGGIYLDEGSGFIEVTGNLVYDVRKPMNYNNLSQNRKATCKEHGNFFGANADAAKHVAKKAGLEAEYRNLFEMP